MTPVERILTEGDIAWRLDRGWRIVDGRDPRVGDLAYRSNCTTTRGEAVSDHLIGKRTDRGFMWMPPIDDALSPGHVRVSEASTADGPHIWLRLMFDDTDGNHAVALLPAEQAWQLKDQIEYLLEHHHQGDARPVMENQTDAG